MTDVLTTAIESVMGTLWIYPIAAFFIFFDCLAPVMPSEVILNLTGAWSAARGAPDLYAIFGVAVMAAVAGDNVCYLLGTRLMPFIRRVPPNSKAADGLSWVRRNMRRGAGAAILVARFIPSARFFMTILLGSMRYPWPLFFFFDTLGVILWAIQGLAIGYAGGALLSEYPILALGLSIVMALVVGWVVQKLQLWITDRLDTRRGYAETP